MSWEGKMNEPLEIKDSQLNGIQVTNEFLVPLFLEAIDELNKQFLKGSIKEVSFNSYRATEFKENPIFYDNISTRPFGSNNRPIVTGCKFYTSHYVGSFSYNGISIIITPRFGATIFSYLMKYATNLYIPNSLTAFTMLKANPSWLIVLVWKAMLNKALINSHIPKQYISEQKNLRYFKGRLLLSKHLKQNLVDKSWFYCSYHKLSADNVINQTIRYTLRILKKYNVSTLLQEYYGYDEKLESIGVSNSTVTIEEIDSIKFNKLTYVYKDVVEVSKLIISHHNSKHDATSNWYNGLSYFIDIAELWEMYILKLLQRKLKEFRVYSPNIIGGEYLLNGKSRSIRPDIIIEKKGRIVMIIDAKYKRYSKIGQSASEINCVSREDLYQMCTYLYHYGNEGDKIVGLFVSPFSKEENENLIFTNNSKHRIGILNLPLDSINNENSVRKIIREEESFICRISNLLNNL